MILVEGFEQRVEHNGQHQVIARVPHWQVAKGDAWLILGASGCGKTTFINALTGLIRPSLGLLEVDGVDIAKLTPQQGDRFRGQTFGIVFQTLRLISSLNVQQNLELALTLAGQKIDSKRIDDLLDTVGLEQRRLAKPRTLSTGEAQRAALARALITRPKILVADEPTSALDDQNTQKMALLLKALAKEAGSTLIIASHDHRLIQHFPTHLMITAPQ